MPNGVSRQHNSRHSNRHRQQDSPPIVLATVVDTRVVIEGQNLDLNELDELRREIRELKQGRVKELKEHGKLMKESHKLLDPLFKKCEEQQQQLKELNMDKNKLGGYLMEYESVIQQLEDEGYIRFKNQTPNRRIIAERTLKNLDFMFVHDKEGKEIPFKDLHIIFQELEDKNERLKGLCHQLIKQSLPNGGSMKIVKEPNKEVEVSINHDDSGEISNDNNYKEWSWKGVDYRIDVDNKKVFDMDGREVGETIGKIPTLWDKWWEELD